MTKVINVKSSDQFESLEIRLSYDEAKALHDILRNVGGSPTMSRRRFSDAIYYELRKEFSSPYSMAHDTEGSIRFT